jgi:hypothetical protein
MLTANRLSDGAVVYWTSDGGWSDRLEAGYVLISADQSAAAEAAGARAQADLLVVGAYVMDVRTNGAVPEPVKMREIIRAAGPSVRLDLGKQAGA